MKFLPRSPHSAAENNSFYSQSASLPTLSPPFPSGTSLSSAHCSREEDAGTRSTSRSRPGLSQAALSPRSQAAPRGFLSGAWVRCGPSEAFVSWKSIDVTATISSFLPPFSVFCFFMCSLLGNTKLHPALQSLKINLKYCFNEILL